MARPGLRRRWHALVEPRPDGLPNLRVVLAFPALVLLAVVVLTTLGLNGTSSGFMRQWFDTGADPDLVAFAAEPIRVDEWGVQTPYIVSQVQEGLPVRNETLPGGVDMTLNWEAPYREWSAAFRPHNLGFLVLGLDQAFSWRWWTPGAALLAASYVFLVTLWPRRPGAAALTAVAFVASPFFQWWYLPQTLWPAAWAMLAMTGVVWTQAMAGRARWWWAAGLGYVTTTAALGIYAPFLIPAGYVVAAFALGWVLRKDSGLGLRVRLARLTPVLVGGLVAVALTAAFLATRWDTIEGFLGTVYPGQRLTPTGSTLGDPHWHAMLLGLFSLALADGSSLGIGANSSEASTFVFVGAFVGVAAVWLAIGSWRRRALDVPVLAALGCGVVFLAFLYLPGWDALAHLIVLDRVTPSRMLIGFGLLSVVLIALVVRRLDEQGRPTPWPLAGGVAAVVLVAHVAVGLRLQSSPALAAAIGPYPVLALVLAVAVLGYLRRAPLVGSAAYAGLALVLAGWVHPLYDGVFDLRTTDVGREVSRVEAADPGTWVGVGDSYVGQVITETGVGGMNGFQAGPDRELWEQVDPEGEYETEWNRFANVGWVADEEVPRVFNPAPDQVRIRFDACAPFEQSQVQYVLADRELDGACLEQVQVVPEAVATYTVYRVVPPR